MEPPLRIESAPYYELQRDLAHPGFDRLIDYHYTSDLPRSLPLVRTLWRLEVFALLVLGVGVTAFASWRAGRPSWIAASVAWCFLGLFFVAGLYLFEALAARWARRASPDAETRGD